MVGEFFESLLYGILTYGVYCHSCAVGQLNNIAATVALHLVRPHPNAYMLTFTPSFLSCVSSQLLFSLFPTPVQSLPNSSTVPSKIEVSHYQKTVEYLARAGTSR